MDPRLRGDDNKGVLGPILTVQDRVSHRIQRRFINNEKCLSLYHPASSLSASISGNPAAWIASIAPRIS